MRRHGHRVVAIGGGSGPSLVARALPHHLDRLTAIVTAADSGSSSGVIRDNFACPAPGDLRATLSAILRLCPSGAAWADVLEYRLQPSQPGQLSQMALGNLILTALHGLTGDFEEALDRACRLLGVPCRVLPVSADRTHLMARLDDGSVVRGEAAVRGRPKARIREVFLDNPRARASERACQAIMEADVVVIGPGNLFTSVVACLVVPGLAEALRETRARRVYIANTTTFPGQTDGFTVLDHVETIVRYAGNGHRALDAVVVNDARPAQGVISAYQGLGVTFIPVREWEIQAMVHQGLSVIAADLLEEGLTRPRTLHKLDTIRHDPARLGEALCEYLEACPTPLDEHRPAVV